MATASSSYDIKGHAIAVMVVLEIYPLIMREMICNTWTPKQVLMLIQNDQDKTFMKHLTSLEERTILEMETSGYNNLDVSCLYKIIRQCKLLPPPKQGWGQEPKPEDQCEGDDVERMKRYRNDIIHRPRAGLSESSKLEFFQSSFEIAKRMDVRNNSPQNGFESRIKDVQLNIVGPEKYIEALEKCAEYQAKLQEPSEASCFNLHYGNDIKLQLGCLEEDETNGDSLLPCTLFLKDPNFNVNAIIEMLDDIKEKLRTGDYAMSLIGAASGSLNLHVLIHNRCFMTYEILHKAIQLFLCDFFRAASIECKQGQTYTVVLAKSSYLVSDYGLSKREDVDYLTEKPSQILKLNVNVKYSAFQNEFRLYGEVNRFLSGMYNAVDSHTTPLNGSSRDVYLLTDQERDQNCTSSLAVLDDPQLRHQNSAQVASVKTTRYQNVDLEDEIRTTRHQNSAQVASVRTTRYQNVDLEDEIRTTSEQPMKFPWYVQPACFFLLHLLGILYPLFIVYQGLNFVVVLCCVVEMYVDNQMNIQHLTDFIVQLKTKIFTTKEDFRQRNFGHMKVLRIVFGLIVSPILFEFCRFYGLYPYFAIGTSIFLFGYLVYCTFFSIYIVLIFIKELIMSEVKLSEQIKVKKQLMADWYKDDLILRVGTGVLIANILNNLQMVLKVCFAIFLLVSILCINFLSWIKENGFGFYLL